MVDRTPLFGSFALHAVFAKLGLRSSDVAASMRKTPVVEKHIRQPTHNISLQKVRLSLLHSELLILFHDETCPDQTLPFVLEVDEKAPRLTIGDRAFVTVDCETGLLVFTEREPQAGLIVVTTNEDRLIDHIVCHLSTIGQASASETANRAARMLVGQSLVDVERRIILQTLRHCNGNRTRMSEMLGISLPTIRGKLREYWRAFATREEQQS